MRSTMKSILLPLFALAMSIFLILAFLIVFIQITGIVVAQGSWINGAYDSLARPSIIAAIATGVLGYAYYTTTDKKTDDED